MLSAAPCAMNSRKRIAGGCSVWRRTRCARSRSIRGKSRGSGPRDFDRLRYQIETGFMFDRDCAIFSRQPGSGARDPSLAHRVASSPKNVHHGCPRPWDGRPKSPRTAVATAVGDCCLLSSGPRPWDPQSPTAVTTEVPYSCHDRTFHTYVAAV